MQELRVNIRNIIFGLTGIVVIMLGIRFLLVLFAANPSHALSKLIFDGTQFLMPPFVGLERFPIIGGELIVIIIAMAVYLVLGLLVSGLVTAFLREKPLDIFVEVIDIIFKFFEFILVSRLILKLFAVRPGTASFVDTIYNNTEWTGGLLPQIDVFGGTLEFSTLFILVIVVIVDLATENAIAALVAQRKQEATKKAQNVGGGGVSSHTTVVRDQAPTPQVPFVPNQPQNITINVPSTHLPPPVPRAARKQVINVHPPSPGGAKGKSEGEGKGKFKLPFGKKSSVREPES